MKKILKVILVCAIPILIYTIYLTDSIYQSIKISKKLIAHAIPYTQHPSNPDKYILVAGDSTAVGVGAINSQKSIAGRLGQQFPHADITNLGKSGATLSNLFTVLQEQKRKYYDLIVLQIGANDITHFTSCEAIKTELSEILSLCNTLSPKTVLLTAGNIGRARVFHWPLSTFITARTWNIRKIFIKEASKYKTVFYIDLFKDPKNDPFEKNLKKYYAPDSFHLTDEGYGIWYAQVQTHLPSDN